MEEMSELEALRVAYLLAQKYGEEMRLFGMSQEWTSPRECPDTTDKLRSNEQFRQLPKDYQSEILTHGNKMMRFGLGCYQENTGAAAYYDKCGGRPPVNPFVQRLQAAEEQAREGSQTTGGSQPGE